MTTEQEIVEIVKNTRIDFDATPQNVMGPGGDITSQEDFERSQRQLYEDVGRAYWFIDVRDMSADLALMRCTSPGYWETEIIPGRYSPLLYEDLVRAVEDAGGAIHRSGHYPLDETCLWKVRESYLGG